MLASPDHINYVYPVLEVENAGHPHYSRGNARAWRKASARGRLEVIDLADHPAIRAALFAQNRRSPAFLTRSDGVIIGMPRTLYACCGAADTRLDGMLDVADTRHGGVHGARYPRRNSSTAPRYPVAAVSTAPGV